MKKIYKLLLAIVLCSTNIFGQGATYQWANQLSSPTNESGHDIVSDGSGNVYAVGDVGGVTDLDPSAATATVGVGSYLVKYNTLGSYQWKVPIGGSGTCRAVILDGLGNVYITGYITATADFDPTAGVANLTPASSGFQSGFIAKYSTSGTYVWAKLITGTSCVVSSADISIFSNGDICIGGLFNGTADFDPNGGTFNMSSLPVAYYNGFIAKYSSAGNFIFAKQIGVGSAGKPATNITALKVDNSNNIICVGRSAAQTSIAATADFDPGAGIVNFTVAGTSSINFIEKLDVNGNYLWAYPYGVNTYANDASDINIDNLGNLYFLGLVNPAADIDPGVSTNTITGFYVAKYDNNGNYLAAMNTKSTGKIIFDQSGNVTLSSDLGATTFDFDPGPGVANLTGYTTYCGYYAKYTPTLTYISALMVGGFVNSHSTYNGAFYTIGDFFAITDFDPNAGVQTFTNASYDSFVDKYLDCSGTPSVGTINGINSLCNGFGTTSYSIAIVNGATSYTWSLPSGWSGSSSTNSISATTGTASGNISVSAINACGTSSASVISVTVNTLPTITASTNNSLLCTGQTATLTASGASTYTWNPGGAGTSISVSPTVTSTYTINGTDANGCMNSSAFTQSVSLCTGIQQNSIDSDIAIYPNPTNGIVSLRVSKLTTSATVEIFDAQGNKINSTIITKDNSEIDLSKEANGIYYLKMTTPKGFVSIKIIKE